MNVGAGEPILDGKQSDELPSLGESVREQIGGVRGILESSAPVLVFIAVNNGLHWGLRAAILSAVGSAVLIAGLRLVRRQPVRYALNGLFGVAIAADFAWYFGEARDFFLPGIILSYTQAAVFLLSVLFGHPAIGHAWGMIERQARGLAADPHAAPHLPGADPGLGGRPVHELHDPALPVHADNEGGLGTARILGKSSLHRCVRPQRPVGARPSAPPTPTTCPPHPMPSWWASRWSPARPDSTRPSGDRGAETTSWTSSSTSAVQTKISSSPASSGSSGVGTSTRLPRRIATSAVSRGSGTSRTGGRRTARPAAG